MVDGGRFELDALDVPALLILDHNGCACIVCCTIVDGTNLGSFAPRSPQQLLQQQLAPQQLQQQLQQQHSNYPVRSTISM